MDREDCLYLDVFALATEWLCFVSNSNKRRKVSAVSATVFLLGAELTRDLLDQWNEKIEIGDSMTRDLLVSEPASWFIFLDLRTRKVRCNLGYTLVHKGFYVNFVPETHIVIQSPQTDSALKSADGILLIGSSIPWTRNST
jgi:hypothetical protein